MRFTLSGDLDITAPGLIAQDWSEAEVLGATVWLWMHSASHKEMPLHSLPVLLLPAIKNRQFILAAEAGLPVFYLAWANLSLEAEQRYLDRHPLLMREEDWNSGDRMWLLDWIAPFGHSRIMRRLLERQLLAGGLARTLYHRGDERGLKIKTFYGKAIPSDEAQSWFQSHPAAIPPKREMPQGITI